MNGLLLCLLSVYVFVVQFGNLFRFSQAESVPGVSTIIFGAVVVISLARATKFVFTNNIYRLLLILIFLTSVASVLNYNYQDVAFKSLFVFSAYVIFSAGIASVDNVTAKQLYTIWFFVAFGLVLSSGLSIIDYLKIVHIPFCNDVRILSEFGVSEVEQASGFFLRRSAMAAVFSISISGSFMLFFSDVNLCGRLFFLTSALSGVVCLFLTHNRSGILSIITSLLLFLLIAKRIKFAIRFKSIVFFVVILISSFFIIKYMFPLHIQAVSHKFNSVSRSDYGRVELFLYALNSLSSNPIGNGFVPMAVKSLGVTNPHNIVTGFVWSVGIFAFVWIPLFFVAIKMYIFNRIDVYNEKYLFFNVCCVSLLSWLLNNMTHYNLNTGLAWVIFGLLFVFTKIDNRLPGRSGNI